MSEETIKCPNCGIENNIDENNKFCKECGKNLSKYVLKKDNLKDEVQENIAAKENIVVKMVTTLFSNIFELVSFLISACIMSLVFIAPLVIAIIGMSDSLDSENVFQQIYNSVNMTSIALGIGIGVIAGLVVTATLRIKVQLNKIENKIAQIQKDINK